MHIREVLLTPAAEPHENHNSHSGKRYQRVAAVLFVEEEKPKLGSSPIGH